MCTERKCYCDSGKPFKQCCEPLLLGLRDAGSPLELMRSRFTAYKKHNDSYLERTAKLKALEQWRKHAKKAEKKWVEWRKLVIVDSPKVGLRASKGVVEFKAYYLEGVQECCLHERSRFQKIANKWYYVAGTVKY